MHDSLIMVCEHARETLVINAGVLFVFSPGVPDSYPVAIYVSDWIVQRESGLDRVARAGSYGIRQEKSSLFKWHFSDPSHGS